MRERARSASRSRRDERRTSQSVRGSHDSQSAAGNLSPGRHHGRRESNGGGGFFKNLFGSRRHRDQSPQPAYPAGYQGEPYPEGGMMPPPPPPAPASSSPASKLKALLSFAPARHASPGRGGNVPPTPPPGVGMGMGPGPVELPRGATDDLQVKNMQHQMQLMQAQMQDYQTIKTQLLQEQRQAQEWREKWNFQDLKLNLMVDMLVLRVLELEQPGVYAGGGGGGGGGGAGQPQGR